MTIVLVLLLLPFIGPAISTVFQKPTTLIATPGGSVDVQCWHDAPTHNVLLWYRQYHTRSLELLGILFVSTDNTEDTFKHKIELAGEASASKTSSITVKDLVVNDSAVYFCASSQHSHSTPQSHSTKTPPCLLHSGGSCVQAPLLGDHMKAH